MPKYFVCTHTAMGNISIIAVGELLAEVKLFVKRRKESDNQEYFVYEQKESTVD